MSFPFRNHQLTNVTSIGCRPFRKQYKPNTRHRMKQNSTLPSPSARTTNAAHKPQCYNKHKAFKLQNHLQTNRITCKIRFTQVSPFCKRNCIHVVYNSSKFYTLALVLQLFFSLFILFISIFTARLNPGLNMYRVTHGNLTSLK